MELGIRGKTALVTGAGKGIGRAIAASLAEEGAKLAVCGRTPELLKQLCAQLPNGPHKHLAIDLMTDRAAEKVAEWLGADGGSADIIVHNVGGSLGVTDPLASALDWEKVWRFNVGIGAQLNHLLVPAMIKKGWGRIVHISSQAAETAHGYAAYASAKGALEVYVRAVGRAVAKHNVVISAVAPGAIEIEGRYFSKIAKEKPEELEEYFRHHLQRRKLGKPEDIGPVVAFFCSNQAAFASGGIVPVNGGGA